MEIHASMPTFSPEAYVSVIKGENARVFRSFYNRIAKQLLFPDYFGRNLDALFDCLCSLEVIGNQEIVLVITNASLFLSKEKPEKRQSAIEILQSAEKKENRYDAVKFKVFFVQ